MQAAPFSPSFFVAFTEHLVACPFFQLLGNAIKFTDEGSVTVQVSTKGKTDAGRVVYRLEVQDTGRGISEKVVSTIFEPFSKAHNYSHNEGSGLGLSIVKRYAETLGGQVGVSTQVGNGSTFWIEVPLKIAPPSVADHFHLLSLGATRSPLPMFGVGVGEKTFRVLSDYLSFWNVPFEIISSPAHLSSFTHLIVEEGHPSCPQAEVFFETVKATLHQRAILLSTFASHHALKSRKEIKGVQDLVVIVPSPLTPIKISKAFSFALGIPHIVTPDPSESPLHRPQSETTDSSPPTAPLPSSASPKVRDSLDVLLVEDNPVTQLVFKKQFEKMRVSFAIAGSAEESLSIRSQYPGGISLIMMDVELNGPMTGLEATKAIRHMEREAPDHRRTFIAIMTGRSLEEDRREAFDSGCDEFLVKPLSLVQTRDLIYRFVQTPS